MNVADPRFERAYQVTLAALLAERNAEGHWTGELSTSALSTATAVAALSLVEKNTPRLRGRLAGLISGGLDWLAKHQNADGGWGDTVVSFSNISTTMLCRAAFHLADSATKFEVALQRAEGWLGERYGKTSAELAEAVRARYGKDRTFAVPILTTCALAGLTSWQEVPSLPFELACFPQSWFRFLNLQVVSYALPALIAIGQAVYHHRPPWNPLTRFVRWLARRKSLKVLEAIQPSSGGYLEATPLTSFVSLSLASIGLADHPVVTNGVRFLENSVRADGSWPIDTNLATWVTTLSVNALAAAGELPNLEKKPELVDWLLRQQYKERHPYTGAAPGAWAWTPLPGGVPDADDTPGALLALQALWENTPKDPSSSEVRDKVLGAGRDWLFNLQNNDWGIPTFCSGWGKLPFDRSGSDLTAHALRAMAKELDNEIRKFKPTFWTLKLDDPWVFEFAAGCLSYLEKQQRPDGSWLPLWFGNQHSPNDENPTYGTTKVLAAYRDLTLMNYKPTYRGVGWLQEECRGVAWLLAAQNADGGWGGAANVPSSMEETALAVEVLIDAGSEAKAAVNNGLAYLVQQVEAGGLNRPTPIGFYFAKLWYFEKLYPIIFTLAALGRARMKSKTPAS